ncbi:hypothetical protein DL764_001962 [Monosporascus ibericus]|uniref:Integral membrane protein n=1 Tax=Monosporascus ibericus TaxID=155417 RepID=A0A4Q4TSF2_9PEZI|nr:hypothetical protein DL764_001962 [Monosporascus ibericus]
MASDEDENGNANAGPNPPSSSRRASQSTIRTVESEQRRQQQRQPPPSAARNVPFRAVRDNPPAIRLRRVRSLRPDPYQSDGGELQSTPRQQQQRQQEQGQQRPSQPAGRRRSSSEPYRRWFTSEAGEGRPRLFSAAMPSASEMSQSRSRNVQARDFQPSQSKSGQESASHPHGGRARPRLFRQRDNMFPGRRGSAQGTETEYEYDPDIVDILDVVDPEVATLSSITNIQNSLFVPSLGRFVNRQPTYTLSQIPHVPGAFPPSQEDVTISRPVSAGGEDEQDTLGDDRPPIERIPSVMTERFYAVRPHNASLEDWTEEEIAELNDHVRHMLHSRRSKIKRRFKAFGQYVRKPLGFLVTLYATLITLFGLAWVLFLIGWIYVGDQQLYVINVIDTVLVSLFAIVGDGLIPWRIIDTYHMCYIAHYHHLTWKLRKKMALPHLQDKNDLPSEPAVRGSEEVVDIEAARTLHEKEELTVLTSQQQRKLEHHQAKFSKSHTFYKPHETETHYAFPLRLLVAIVVLLDCHSIFQLALGLSTWCIDYRVRPMALTATLLCFSISVNIVAGVLISVGDRRTRKRDVIERMFRQELTREAMKRVNKAKANEAMERVNEGSNISDCNPDPNSNSPHSTMSPSSSENKDDDNNNKNTNNSKREKRQSVPRLLEKIDEGRESGRSSLQIHRSRLDFLGRKSSERTTRRSGEHGAGPTSPSRSRKSLDRAGRFDPLPDAGEATHPEKKKGDGDGGTPPPPPPALPSPPPVVGAFPQEEDDDEK